MNGLAKHVAALTLGVVAFAAPLQAQGPQFLLGAGLGLPLGEFGDFAKTGFHGTAGVAIAPASLPVGLRLDGTFSHFGTEFDDVSWRTLSLTGNAVYNFKTAETSRIAPYLIGGVGLYNNKATGDGAEGAESETDFGINAGAGFNVAAGAASVFVEGRFHNVFTDGNSQQFIPLTVGVRLGGK